MAKSFFSSMIKSGSDKLASGAKDFSKNTAVKDIMKGIGENIDSKKVGSIVEKIATEVIKSIGKK